MTCDGTARQFVLNPKVRTLQVFLRTCAFQTSTAILHGTRGPLTGIRSIFCLVTDTDVNPYLLTTSKKYYHTNYVFFKIKKKQENNI